MRLVEKIQARLAKDDGEKPSISAVCRRAIRRLAESLSIG